MASFVVYPPSPPHPPQSVDRYMQIMVELADRNFDKFELFCARNVLCLPGGLSTDTLSKVLLSPFLCFEFPGIRGGRAWWWCLFAFFPEHSPHRPLAMHLQDVDMSHTAEEEEALDAELQELRQHARKMSYAITKVQSASGSIGSASDQLRILDEHVSELTSQSSIKEGEEGCWCVPPLLDVGLICVCFRAFLCALLCGCMYVCSGGRPVRDGHPGGDRT